MSTALQELDEIIRSSDQNNINHLDFLLQILDTEIKGRENKRICRRINTARFPIIKTIADFDFTKCPSLNKHQILSYCDGSFLEENENLILVGPPGTGKTHLSIAIGYELCQRDKSVFFTTGTALINRMNEAKDEKALSKFFNQASKWDLIIIDEIGYFPFEKNESELLFQYISERYERGSIIITTNLPFSQWNEIFYTERLTTAMLDRLIHHCNIIEFSGESYRFANSLKKKSAKKKK
ncbi:MAG: IS21-like element helper ATPase IstB [Bacteroidales bacterium]|nr:IS21-like element helper ATPase IstB [Bacteroidales bacterium]